jgi:RNA polymerase primary sigma factor
MPTLRANPMDSYLQEINATPLLDGASERELSGRILDGDRDARDHMVRANLRLVVRIARDFTGRGLCLQELVQEGNLGLMRAVEGFDPTVGTRFSTYARYWIIQSIQRALDNMGSSVRVPGYAADLVANWRRTAHKLREELGRAPTEEEIAKRMQLSVRKLRIVQKALRIYNGPTASNDEGKTLDSMMMDHSAADPSAALSRADDVRQVVKLLDNMEPREAAILRLRFGLNGGEPLTLGEIGDQLGLTRERVRQLERDALIKLRDMVGAEEAA